MKTTMRMHQNMFEQELKVQDQIYLKSKFEEFQDYLRRFDSVNSIEKRKQMVDNLQQRIWTGDHRGTYQAACVRRQPGTGSWLLEHSRYRSWRDASFSCPWNERLLLIQGTILTRSNTEAQCN